MHKQWIPWTIVALFAVILGYDLFQDVSSHTKSDLTPNWNYSSATGFHRYQEFANSFVFVTKRNAESASWKNGDYGEHEYALFVVQRGTGEVICPAYSAVSVKASDVDLAPFVGKAVLVTSFTESPETRGEISLERLVLDEAVNQKMDAYREACPVPFAALDESLGLRR